MFALEFLDKIKEYRNSQDINEKKIIIKSLYNLANENKESFQKLISEQGENLEIKEIIVELERYENESKEIQKNSNESEDDIIKIKNAFLSWENEFKKSNDVNEMCSQIVDQILDFYMKNRYYVIKQILEIENGENYEKFKSHIKNKIRARISREIKKFLNSKNYSELNFFSKIKKKKEVRLLTEEIKEYKFNLKKVEEVLQ